MLIASIAFNRDKAISSGSSNAYKSKNVVVMQTIVDAIAVVRERLVYGLLMSLAIGETFMIITMMKMIVMMSMIMLMMSVIIMVMIMVVIMVVMMMVGYALHMCSMIILDISFLIN
jgi:hypothetical protein